MNRLVLVFLLFFVSFACSGCARFTVNKTPKYETLAAKPSVNTAVAKKKHQKALDRIRCCQLCEAEQFLREALLADINFGPAHNTLGKVYFDQRKFYLAAWEFEYAMRVMPERAEPYNNLGLVYEAVNRLDQAIEQYEAAISHSPENAQYLGNYLRARIRRGDRTSDLRPMLEELVFLDNRKSWVDWAKQQLVMGDIDEVEFQGLIYGPYESFSETELLPPSSPNGRFNSKESIESLPDIESDESSRRDR